MRITTFLSIAVLFLTLNLNGQSRIISGRVITEDLEPIPMLDIKNPDTLLLGKTDMDGYFKFSIPQKTNRLLFLYLGMEWTEIQLKKDCDTVEVIMMYDGTYDFMTLKKVDRLRKKRFDNLPNIHSEAVKKGLFENSNICYERVFKEYNLPKPERNRIKRENRLKRKHIKSTFKQLEIGDVVKIPQETWSAYTDETDFGCLVAGKIIGKNRKKRDYNLILKVIDNTCENQTATYNGKTVEFGDTITHNMKYFKIVME